MNRLLRRVVIFAVASILFVIVAASLLFFVREMLRDFDESYIQRQLEALSGGNAKTKPFDGADFVCFGYRPENFVSESRRLGQSFLREYSCGRNDSCCWPDSNDRGAVGVVARGEIFCTLTKGFVAIPLNGPALCAPPNALSVQKKRIDGNNSLPLRWDINVPNLVYFEIGERAK